MSAPKKSKTKPKTETPRKHGGAPKGNQLGNKGGGRPPTYDPKFHPQAALKLCERGATNRDLADIFGAAISTNWQWQVEHH